MSGVHIRLMGMFCISIEGEENACKKLRSKKGSLLIQYLILSFSKPVASETLIDVLSLNHTSDNPQNALKTLVSRTRMLLKGISPALDGCICSKHGTYMWRTLPGVTVDVHELDHIFDSISRKQYRLPEAVGQYERFIELYKGDLSYSGVKPDWMEIKSSELHAEYLLNVQEYITFLKKQSNNLRRKEVCQIALSIDDGDKRLHNCLLDVMSEENISRSDVPDSFLGSLQSLKRSLDQNVNKMCGELNAEERSSTAFYCTYDVFKDISDMQFRIVDRIGSTMFIALIGISPADGEYFESERLNEASLCLLDTLKESLRKGDAITQFSPSVFIVTLPMVDYLESRAVLERVKESFYIRNRPHKDVILSYRTQPYTYNGGII